MSPAENQAISILATALTTYTTENREDHAEIKVALKEFAERIAHVEIHCRERETVVTNQINAAMTGAVLEAKRPSVYAQATQGFLHFALRAVTVVALMATLFGAVLAILDKLGLL